MPHPPSDDITTLLHEVGAGAPEASDALLERVYTQLRDMARQRMARERPGHTLQATALVHEAYMRLLGDAEVQWRDRVHFYMAAAESMRRILIDHARRRGAEKRGGDRTRLPMNICDLAADNSPRQILAVDQAILRLGEQDPSAADVVRLRFFAGLSVDQTAAALGLSERTVRREWTYARATLFRILEESGSLD